MVRRDLLSIVHRVEGPLAVAGHLIAFEGIDGVGKTTQIEQLAGVLRETGYTVVVTKEPTDGPHGQKIRDLSTRGVSMRPDEELEYFQDDRHEHVQDLIAPALERGEVVITDRYFLSSAAYQGARGLDPEAVLVQSEAHFPIPDAVVLFDLAPVEALRRVRTRGGDRNRTYEREQFLERVQSIFRAFERDYIRVVSVEGDVAAVHAAVLDALDDVFGWPTG